MTANTRRRRRRRRRSTTNNLNSAVPAQDVRRVIVFQKQTRVMFASVDTHVITRVDCEIITWCQRYRSRPPAVTLTSWLLAALSPLRSTNPPR